MVKSPNKVITSGTAPTTTNTTKGDLAFGTVDGETKLYGNTGTEVVELGGGGGSEVNVIAPLMEGTVASAFSGRDSIAVGGGAKATDYYSTAIGAGSTASGTLSTAIGSSCYAPSSSTTVVGYGARSDAESGTAIGVNSKVKGVRSVAIGSNSEANDDDVVSVGAGDSDLGTNPETRRIINVADPTGDQDAATKKYVDDQYTTLESQIDDKGTDITTLQGQVSTLETTVAGKANTSALDNYATKAELNAKADQTTVDSLTTTVNGKVSSITAGEGISITGTATEPVISATGGAVISGFRPNYAAQETLVEDEYGTEWTWNATGDGLINANATYSDGNSYIRISVNGIYVDEVGLTESGTAYSNYVIVSAGDVVKFEYPSVLNVVTFTPIKDSTIIPNEFTDTGWLDISGSGLGYLAGPWTVPAGNKVQIRKFGKRVTAVGMVQATQDIDNTAPVSLISIPEGDANFDAFSLPQVSAYELAHNHNKNAATSVQFVNGVLVALNVKQSTETPKISVELLPFANMAGIPAAKISNGDIVNFQVSWDTEA